MGIIFRWLIVTTAILISAYLVPGVEVSGVWPALWVAVFLGIFNLILRPILVVFTLPVTMLTFGLFIFVINTFLILLISTIVQGFMIEGFLEALIFSVILSVISYLLNYLAESSSRGNTPVRR